MLNNQLHMFMNSEIPGQSVTQENKPVWKSLMFNCNIDASNVQLNKHYYNYLSMRSKQTLTHPLDNLLIMKLYFYHEPKR